MKTMIRACSLAAFLVLMALSQASHAIIITSYTGLFDDGSRLFVDLKGYDYGEGVYFSSPTAWPEYPSIEKFETSFYPSRSLQQQFGFQPGTIGHAFPEYGLNFSVNGDYSVSMTSFDYLFSSPDWSVTDTGVHVQDLDYHHYVGFSGGFFETYTSPFEVDEPKALALILIGFVILAWARTRQTTKPASPAPSL